MIFVTVGTQGPFDRMLRVVDDWAERAQRKDVFAQIGRGAWQPAHVEWVESLAPEAFQQRMQDADLVISHAGMGTILTALELEKPILVMPRKASLHEQRNEHQLATVAKLGELGLVSVVEDEGALARRLDGLDGSFEPRGRAQDSSERLLDALRRFFAGEAV